MRCKTLIGTDESSPRYSISTMRPSAFRAPRKCSMTRTGWESSWYTSTIKIRSSSPSGNLGSCRVDSTGVVFSTFSAAKRTPSKRSISACRSTANTRPSAPTALAMGKVW